LPTEILWVARREYPSARVSTFHVRRLVQNDMLAGYTPAPGLARFWLGAGKMATRARKAAKPAKAPKRAKPARMPKSSQPKSTAARKAGKRKSANPKSVIARLKSRLRAAQDEAREALERQTATAEILKVIASSPTDVQPVFDVIVERAVQLCGARMGRVYRYDGNLVHMVGGHGLSVPGREGAQRPFPRPAADDTIVGRVMLSRRPNILADLNEDETVPPLSRQMIEALGARSQVTMPMLLAGEPIGAITLSWAEPRGYNGHQIALLQTFADQAVIAIENARLFNEVQARTRDLTEALTYQTGSSNILKVIASSPTDVGPVLKAIVESACELCEAADALVVLKDDNELVFKAQHGSIPVVWERQPINRRWASGRAVIDRKPVHVHDLLSAEGEEFPDAQGFARRANVRTVLSVPLLRDNEGIGAIVLRRTEVQPFDDKQIALLQTFADQAVIALGNVRLFEEVEARTRELMESLQIQTATSEVLKVISRSPDALQPVLDAIAKTACELCGSDGVTIFLLRDEKFHFTAVSGAVPKHLEYLRANPVPTDEPTSVFGQVMLKKRTIHYANVFDHPELDQNRIRLGGERALLMVPLLRDDQMLGVIVLRQSHMRPFTPPQIQAIEVFADQAVIAISNVGLFEQVQRRTFELSQSLNELRAAQDRLIQTEKLASLGQLTAGIAHEIKNPLNFVNNFSALSAELTDELNDMLRSAALDEKMRGDVDELTGILKDNLEKVVQHGKRADSIVKNMLLHSREGSGECRPVEINAVIDESLNLAYHGARAEKPGFNITLQRDFDPATGVADVYPQEITRVLLNLISNGFYAATRRAAETGSEFEPTLRAATKNLGDKIEIRIRDNGIGIAPEVMEKIFNPFFTTKPAGEGTGLGLSMSHDIVVKQHGGTIDVDTKPGIFTEFIITLPRAIVPQKTAGDTN
jgi:two-component system NtrC family sensor kinase